MATLTQLSDRVIQRLSMVGGTAAQIYAEDRIAEMIQHKFDALFDERWWHQFLSWGTWTLDGSTGIVTTDLTTLVKRFEDIRVIYKENFNTPLSELSATTMNPYELSGTTPLFFEANASTSRPFKIWPLAATGNIVVQYRTKPDTFDPEDTVNFDDQALILGTVYDYLEDDGTNPNATQKFQNMFEARVAQLKKIADKNPISLDPITTIPQSFTFTELP